MIKRELAPEEVAELAALAAEFPDLRTIRPLVASLRGELEEARSINVDAYTIRPQSIKDLIMLLEKEIVTPEWVKARLPGRGGAPLASVEILSHDPEMDHPEHMGGYVVRDKRVSVA